MTPKKTLNLAVPADLLDEFNTVCSRYGHGKQKGMVLSAAILMFLRADPKLQGQYLHDIMAVDIAAGVKKMLAEKVELARREAAASGEKDRGNPVQIPPQPKPHLKPRKAAKKAGKAVKGISKLPRLEDLNKG